METIDVSVLTPSYGYGRYITDSIESVIQQDCLRIEHIIQDGGSEDETLDVLRSFGDHVVWTSEPDQGQSDALNRALAKATGRWVAWLNADEYYLPGGLARLIHEGERSGADVIFGDAIDVDREGKMIRLRAQHPFSPRILRWYGAFPSVSFIVRREVLDDNPWDPMVRVVMDWELFLGLLAKGAAFRHLAYPVGAYRRHEHQVSMGLGSAETTVVRQRYQIPTHRGYRKGGKVLHRLYKLVVGTYVRQLRARRFQGADLRWFKEAAGSAPFKELLKRCYGESADSQCAGRP
jgi:glycosyltransferase involved in cell wall biosynthesis